MFNKLLAAVASVAMAALPVNARVEEGTGPLIDLLDASGVPVVVNGVECAGDEYHGLYIHSGIRRKMVLCPGDDVEAFDHEVVRHETWHAIQHCVNAARGTPLNSPVVDDIPQLMDDVRDVLDDDYIAVIKQLYPQEKWYLELEAFMAMEIFTADELADLFKEACLYEA